MPDEPLTVTPPTCAECGRPRVDPGERWRSVLALDDLDRLDPGDVCLYCPACAEREFGES